MMELEFRETRITDVDALFDLRARTRENPFSRDDLATMGITPESISHALLTGRTKGWVCTHGPGIVGFCMGEAQTGEILVVAILPQYESLGIGKRLLSLAVSWLRATGAKRIWLVASSNPTARAHGFYRALGWQPTGERAENGGEVLVITPDAGS
jgi:ribosomal protein S18 acetylase RimI-like enzyme